MKPKPELPPYELVTDGKSQFFETRHQAIAKAMELRKKERPWALLKNGQVIDFEL